MRGNTTMQLLECSSSFAGAVPIVGSQLTALIDLAVNVYKLIEEVKTNQEIYLDLGDRLAFLVSAIVVDMNEPSHHEKLNAHMLTLLEDLLQDLRVVKEAIGRHALRDSKTYTRIGAGLRANIRNVFSGLKHRDNDQREVEVLEKRVNNQVERFNVGTIIDSATSLKSISDKIELNHAAVQEIRLAQSRLAKEQEKQAAEQAQQAKEADMHFLKRELSTMDLVQWSNFHDQTYCYAGTRVKLLQYLSTWAADVKGPSILWISGLAGAGKSTLLRSFCKELHDADRAAPAASFFASRKIESQRNPRAVVQTLAHSLALCDTSIRVALVSALKQDGNVTNAQLSQQVEDLLAKPLSQAIPVSKPLVLVVDALDELDMTLRNGEALQLIQLLSDAISRSTTPLKVVMSSRPDHELLTVFTKLKPPCKTIDLHHAALDLVDVKSDIRLYLTEKMRSIEVDLSVRKPWPNDHELEGVIKLAGELFIFASTVVNFTGLKPGDPVEHLSLILNPAHHSTLPDNPYTTLDMLYDTALIASLANVPLNTSSGLREATCRLFRQLVGSIVVLRYPLKCSEISRIVGTNALASKQLIQKLHAVFLWAEDQPIQILHPSFPEYLLSPSRCSEPRLRIDGPRQHRYLALQCLYLLNKHLQPIVSERVKICTLNSEIDDLDTRFIKKATEEIQYASKNWIAHLSFACVTASTSADDDTAAFQEQLSMFLLEKAVLWLEVLSVLGILDSAFIGYNKAQIWMEQSGIAEGTRETFRELYAAVDQFHDGLEESALEAYNSLPVFLPACKLSSEFASKSKSDINLVSARPCGYNIGALGVWRGHAGDVTSVAFSQDGTRIVSGSSDYTVRTWDSTTGTAEATLEGHTDWVNSVAFSPDGRRIISGSYDGTVRIWDSTTGSVEARMEGHTAWVRSVAFSPDGTRIVSGSDDRTMRIWDATTSVIRATLEGHTDWVRSVAFSPDGTRIVSGSSDCTVRIWDSVTGAINSTLQGHTGSVRSVAFSPDGTRIVSGSRDRTVQIWDATTGVIQGTLQGHTDWVRSVAFSPDGTRVVSGSRDRTVRVWDTTTGATQATMQGHTEFVRSVAFSPDGTRIVSGSDDRTMRIWDSTTGAIQATPEGHTDWVRSIAFSLDGTRIVSGSDDRTVRIWDSTTGAAEAILEGHKNDVSSVAFSSDGTRVVSGSYDGTVRVWDAITGAIQATLEDHTSLVNSVSFSPDGKCIISRDLSGASKTWDLRDRIPGFQTSPSYPIVQRTRFPIFSVQHGWLYAQTAEDIETVRLCWIPKQCRPWSNFPDAIASSGYTVALGAQTGPLIILDCSRAVQELLAE